MLKLFRRIRQKLLSQNRISQYLTYAMGEIFLVVIGILIALQINNWNEDRKNQREAVAILKNLKSELTEDFSMMAYTLERLEKRKAGADYLYQLITNDAESVSIPKSTQKITFHKQLVDLENILKRNIPEDISLAKFIELQKSIKNVTK